MKRALLFVLLMAVSVTAQGQSLWPAGKVLFTDSQTLQTKFDAGDLSGVGVGTFASLPVSGVSAGIYVVIDCTTTACTAGGGSIWATRQWDGTSWATIENTNAATICPTGKVLGGAADGCVPASSGGGGSSNLVSVSDFAAPTDGVANASPAFVSALAQAASTGTGVFVPCGSYRIDDPLLIQPPVGTFVEIVGDGDGTCSRLLASSTTNDAPIIRACDSSIGVEANDCSNANVVFGELKIRSLFFEDDDHAGHSSGAGAGTYGIVYNGLERITVENSTFKNFGNSAIECTASSCVSVTFRQNVFDGIVLEASANDYAVEIGENLGPVTGESWIKGNLFVHFHASFGGGILFHNTGALVSENRFDGLDDGNGINAPAFTTKLGLSGSQIIMYFRNMHFGCHTGSDNCVLHNDGMTQGNFFLSLNGTSADAELQTGCIIKNSSPIAVNNNVIQMKGTCAIDAPTITNNFVNATQPTLSGSVISTEGLIRLTTGTGIGVDPENEQCKATGNLVNVPNTYKGTFWGITTSCSDPQVRDNELTRSGIRIDFPVASVDPLSHTEISSNTVMGTPLSGSCLELSASDGTEAVRVDGNDFAECGATGVLNITRGASTTETIFALMCNNNLLLGSGPFDCTATNPAVNSGILAGNML